MLLFSTSHYFIYSLKQCFNRWDGLLITLQNVVMVLQKSQTFPQNHNFQNIKLFFFDFLLGTIRKIMTNFTCYQHQICHQRKYKLISY